MIMNYLDLFQEENEQAYDRYPLAIAKISIISEDKTIEKPYRNYFNTTSSFLLLIDKVVSLVKKDKLKQ